MMTSPAGGQITAAGYEHLLSIQQHQHMLALQQKEAEDAHIKARLEWLEAEQPSEEKHKLAEALRTKDEEVAIMMAAKHKELELMASLLQLREQQIEEFRQCCEAQQLEIQQLKRRKQPASQRDPGQLGSPPTVALGMNSTGRGRGPGSRQAPSAEPTPQLDDDRAMPEALGSPAGNMAVRRGANGSEDHTLQLEREVQRLRLKMEEMESSMSEHYSRNTELAKALAQKTDRVQALEEQIWSLQSSVDSRIRHGGGCSQDDAFQQLHTGDSLGARSASHEAEVPQRPAPRTPANPQLRRGAAMAQSAPRLPSATSQAAAPWSNGFGSGGVGHADAIGGYRQYRQGGADADLAMSALPSEEHLTGRRDSAAGPMPPAGAAAIAAEPMAQAACGTDHTQPVSSSAPSYRSAVRLDSHGGAPPPSHLSLTSAGCLASAGPPPSATLPSGGGGRGLAAISAGEASGPCGPGAGPTEAAEAGRQSQELLREMRSLRRQLGEIERATGVRSSGRSGAEGPGRALGDANPNALTDGGGANEASEPTAAPWVWPRPRDDMRSRSAAALPTLPTLPAVAPGTSPAASSFAGWQSQALPTPPVSTHASQHAGAPHAATGLAPTASLAEFGGWEYRPHSSGDPIDASVAALVNQPNGRYRGWRALLCRLEPGVYLCGTRRVRLRADAAAGVIEASADGVMWADLEDLMRGAEASQHAALERARGAGAPGSGRAAFGAFRGGGLGGPIRGGVGGGGHRGDY